MSRNHKSDSKPFRLAKCTRLLADAAAQRGLTVQAFPEVSTTVVILRLGDHEEIIAESATPQLSAVMYRLTNDKYLTNIFLREKGYRIPRELLTDDLEEARQFLREVKRMVVKPNNLTWGVGVFTNITTAEELEFAFQNALSSRLEMRSGDKKVICQQHLTGSEYRILVVDKQNVFGLRRLPARLFGDGEHTIAELLEKRNSQEPIVIELNELVLRVLKQQSLSLEMVPPKGQSVSVASVANAHAGGATEDVTDRLGEDVKAQARALASEMKLPVVGIDCFSENIETDLGYVIELNSTPDIVLHHVPTQGKPQDVAGAVLDMLFPETKSA